jgi:flavodoxin
MLSIDLFDSKYERQLHEGAVDQLEQHRIDILNDRMQELLTRARSASPEMKASLKQQFEKIKAERDSYYKIKEAGIPGNVPTEKIPGKEELLKGRGRTYYEGEVSEDDVDDFLKAGGKITYGKPQKGPRKPGLGLASRHIGGAGDKMKPSRTGRGAHTQGKPVVSTEDAEKKNSKSPLDQRLQRLKVQARREYPRAHSDEEALLLKLLDKEAQDDRANRQTDARQDAELKRNFSLDREQEDEIQDLQTQVGVREHGGGIGPKQRWQDLMPEGWSDKYDLTPYAVYIDGRQWKVFSSDEHARAVAEKVRANLKRQGRDQKVTIAPSQEYLQKKTTEEDLIEGIRDTASATAVVACLLAGGSLTGCATAPQQTTAQQVLKTGQDVGRTVQMAKKITRAGTEEEVKQELRNLARGLGGRSGELNNSNILRIWKKIKGPPPVQSEPEAPEYGPALPRKRMPQYEGKEIHTREDFIKERDRLLRMIGLETDPANKQILKSAIRQLEGRAEAEGWLSMQQRMVRESALSSDAEQAILKRIMIAHTDLLKQYGPEKVMQAAEEVAYNVGDTQEIGSSDVSGWVKQVEYILGAKP